MKFLYPSAVIRRRASEKGTHSEAFQSWRWVLLAAILLAVVTIGTFYFSVVQAQEANGAITGLTLTSDTPGTLTSPGTRPARRPPTTASTGPSPPRNISHGRSMRDMSIQRKLPKPLPSRTLHTTLSTRSACVLATTKANTKTNPGVARGPRNPYRLLQTPSKNLQRPPLNPRLHPRRAPWTKSTLRTMAPVDWCSAGRLPQRRMTSQPTTG